MSLKDLQLTWRWCAFERARRLAVVDCFIAIFIPHCETSYFCGNQYVISVRFISPWLEQYPPCGIVIGNVASYRLCQVVGYFRCNTALCKHRANNRLMSSLIFVFSFVYHRCPSCLLCAANVHLFLFYLKYCKIFLNMLTYLFRKYMFNNFCSVMSTLRAFSQLLWPSR